MEGTPVAPYSGLVDWEGERVGPVENCRQMFARVRWPQVQALP